MANPHRCRVPRALAPHCGIGGTSAQYGNPESPRPRVYLGSIYTLGVIKCFKRFNSDRKITLPSTILYYAYAVFFKIRDFPKNSEIPLTIDSMAKRNSEIEVTRNGQSFSVVRNFHFWIFALGIFRSNFPIISSLSAPNYKCLELLFY